MYPGHHCRLRGDVLGIISREEGVEDSGCRSRPYMEINEAIDTAMVTAAAVVAQRRPCRLRDGGMRCRLGVMRLRYHGVRRSRSDVGHRTGDRRANGERVKNKQMGGILPGALRIGSMPFAH
jgi:hypothetical protein